MTDSNFDPVLSFFVGGKFGSCSGLSNVVESGTWNENMTQLLHA